VARAFVCVLACSSFAFAQVPGVAPGIPDPAQRNVIVQLFNWRFDEIRQVMPTLKKLGYSHIHVSPPEKSNERVWQWWGRYQPIDFTKIEGPLGSEQDFIAMASEAKTNDMQVVVDIVLNHTVALSDAQGLVSMQGDSVVEYKLSEFTTADFHNRCDLSVNVERCWLSDLLDLKTETPHVRQAAKDYLSKLVALGAAGFRFDAAKHIEADFFPDVLSAVPGKYAFGEFITTDGHDIGSRLAFDGMDYYDFPLLATMRQAFRFGGDLRTLEAPTNGHALPGPKAVTLVRNHDIDRGERGDRGLDAGSVDTFGIGWNGAGQPLERTDIALAYAYILGREDGLPYVFVDMPTESLQDDKLDDPAIVAGIRFHNLSLAGEGGVQRRPDVWRIETQNVIGWQRGNDRFVVINKAGAQFDIVNLQTDLQPGSYTEVRSGQKMQVQANGTIQQWQVSPRSAVMFIHD
jgi:alpha-amylase